MLLAIIVLCEVGFWVLLSLGLFSRYVLQWKKISKVLLICVPLIDVVLLIVTSIDFYYGATANLAHGLAAVYIAFTIVFGPSMIDWADQRFAYKFSNGPSPWKPPESGWEYTRYEWFMWFKGVLACLIAFSLIALAIFLVDNPERTNALWAWFPLLVSTMGLWLILWPLWFSLFPKKST
jgi:hypothetical protein